MASEDMERWLNLQPPAVKKKLTPRTFAEAGPMYHMSLDGNIKKFTPYVTRRTSNNENTSIPRVSVAPSILGCFIGYCSAWGDSMYPDISKKSTKNGWYLYDIPYRECIRPSEKVLWDVGYTDEHWLVTYDTVSRQYPASIVAKMFYSEMILRPIVGNTPRLFVKIVVEVIGTQVSFGDNTTLTTGYWEITGPEPMQVEDWKSVHEYTVKKMSGSEYAAAKKYTADLLSLNPPTSMRWGEQPEPFRISAEGLSEILSKAGALFKTRKPDPNLPGESEDYRKRQQAVSKFIAEMNKTYLNNTWLGKQKFSDGEIKAGDISSYFVIDGKLGDKPLDNMDLAKDRVKSFISKWEGIINTVHGKVKAIDSAVKAKTKGAAINDATALKIVSDAVEEFNAIQDPMKQFPQMTGTSLGNKVYSKVKENWLEVTVTKQPENYPTLPALNKEQVYHAATIVKALLNGDWAPTIKWFSWLDHSDGHEFNDWLSDSDESLYMKYYSRFDHHGAGERWTYSIEGMFDEYPLAIALLKWIDRSVL